MQPPSSDILKPGDTIGGCTIKGRIAAGGMGTVYRARKESLEKTVAVKVLHPQSMTESDQVQRFMREAKVAASIDHPAVVEVYDVGQDHGLYYMVMEYLEGSDLRSQVMETGPLPPRKALRIARQVAEALAHAHDQGLIHRDVKPANLLMTATGDVKLVDFGLARLAGQEHEVTVTGQIIGTPAFMSPEQCRGDPLDGRSDLYSLGATIYFLLSGAVPFSAKTPTALIHQVINDPPPPLKSVAPDVPDKLVALVQRLMTKHASARPQSGNELIAAIDEVLLGRYSVTVESPAPPPARTGSSAVSWSTIALVMLLGLMIGAVFYLARSAGASAAPGPDGAPQQQSGTIPSTSTPMIRQVVSTKITNPQLPTAPDHQDEFYELKERVPELLEKLFSGDADLASPYLDPTEQGIPRLHRAVAEVVDLIAFGAVTQAQHVTSQARPGTGRTILSLTMRDNDTVTVIIGWIHVDDAWYVESIAKRDDR